MAANNDPDAAAKAAAAKEAAERKATEDAAKKQQAFAAKYRVLVNGKYAAPGEKVRLSREQYETLKGLGAIEGDWK